ncbi:MAG: uroporphyrinogen-III synthase [Candidatus Dormibacteria bacterium]
MNALLTGTQQTAQAAERYLQSCGWEVTCLPLITTVSLPRETWSNALLAAIRSDPYGYCVVTSKRAAEDLSRFCTEHALPEGWSIMAVGSQTGHALHAPGMHITVIPNHSTAAASLTGALQDLSQSTVLLIGARLMDKGLADAVQSRGGKPVHIVTYDTITPESSRETLATWTSRTFDLGIFWSASAARSFTESAHADRAPRIDTVVALGEKAAVPLRSYSSSIHVPASPDIKSLLTLLAQFTHTNPSTLKEHV